MSYQPGFRGIPPVIKNILIINVLLFIASNLTSDGTGFNFNQKLALYYFESPYFQPYQFVTYMFMHANLTHILFNMLAAWMLGMTLEQVWGPKKFLIYYMVTGIGAALVQQAYTYYELHSVFQAIAAFDMAPSPDAFISVIKDKFESFTDEPQIQAFLNEWIMNPGSSTYKEGADEIFRQLIEIKMNIPTVGASGAVFGILIAFGMLFPNVELIMLFFPIPIKAKYFVLIYGGLELFLGVMNRTGDNVAHFAHLGGALFGFILIKMWNRKSQNLY
jgi:membrane associated rhomboid family serine protease